MLPRLREHPLLSQFNRNGGLIRSAQNNDGARLLQTLQPSNTVFVVHTAEKEAVVRAYTDTEYERFTWIHAPFVAYEGPDDVVAAWVELVKLAATSVNCLTEAVSRSEILERAVQKEVSRWQCWTTQATTTVWLDDKTVIATIDPELYGTIEVNAAGAVAMAIFQPKAVAMGLVIL